MQNKPQGRKKNISGQGKEIETNGPAPGQGPVGSQDGYSGRDMNGPSGPAPADPGDADRSGGSTVSKPVGQRPSGTAGVNRPASGSAAGGTAGPRPAGAAGVNRPASGSTVSKPVGQRPAGTARPTGATGAARPAGTTGTARPTGTTGAARPAGTTGTARPAGTTGTARPAGTTGTARPAGAGTASRPAAQRPSGTGGTPRPAGGGGPVGPSGGGSRMWIIIAVIVLLLIVGGGGFSGLFGGGNDGGSTANLPLAVTDAPTRAPTKAPTQAPTKAPTQAPTKAPTQAPTAEPAGQQGGLSPLSSLSALLGGWYTDAGSTNVDSLSGQFAESAYKPAPVPNTGRKATEAPRATDPPAAASGVRAPYTAIRGGGRDTVTLMVYMCGTDLESKSAMATRDLQEMLAASFGDNVRLVILTGGCASWRNNLVSSKYNQLWQVKNGKLACLSENNGTASMVDPSTLSDFIRYCKKNFEADRYGLIFWDHGSGSVSGYGYDEKNPRAGSMTLSGIDKALTQGGVKFDFVGFDACLMATVENALMLAGHADYMIASEETEPGYGWYYTDWLTALGRNTSMPTAELGQKIVDDFVRTSAKQAAGQKTTLSVIDLAKLSAAVPDRLTAWARSISGMIESKQYKAVANARNGAREFAESNRLDQVDLIDLAQRMGTKEGSLLAEAVSGAVLYNRTSSNMRNANGLSIYFPYQRLSNVDKAVNAYNQLGMDDSYIACIRQFASLEMSGQNVSGGSASPWGALSGSSSSQSAYGDSELLSSLLNSLLGGDYGRLGGMDAGNTSFVSAGALPLQELTAYLSENMIDPKLLVFADTADGKKLTMPADQWALVKNIKLNCFYDNGTGYLDLGLDGLYVLDDDGFWADTDGTWLAIDGRPVPYYELTSDEDNRTGYVPALLNGDRVQLLISFDPEGRGYIVGARMDYVNGETDTVAKSISGLPIGATLQFVCDYYSYEGEYQATWLMYDPMTVTGETMEVTDVYIDKSKARLTYRLTDIYNQVYWTEAYRLQ